MKTKFDIGELVLIMSYVEDILETASGPIYYIHIPGYGSVGVDETIMFRAVVKGEN